MTDWIVWHESTVRGVAFVTLLVALGLAERLRPCRGDARPARRQAINLTLVALDTLMIRLVFPILGVALAARLREAEIGLFAVLGWPAPVEIGLAIVALDLTIYLQHRLLHLVPLLWRAHRVHHSDLAFDVTLGVRFHPFEITLSQLLKYVAIAVLGPAPLAVLLFEGLLQAGALFTHTDVALSPRLDRLLRWLIVTPSMHRVHHSIERDELNSNFGFNLVWWDRLFGTYRPAPRRPEASMPIGLDEFRDPAEQSLLALLVQPFRRASPAARAVPEHRRA